MRKLLIICCFLFIFSCQDETKKDQKPTFLIGNWKRLNDKPGSQTYEMWNTNLVGMGYTMKGKKDLFKKY